MTRRSLFQIVAGAFVGSALTRLAFLSAPIKAMAECTAPISETYLMRMDKRWDPTNTGYTLLLLAAYSDRPTVETVLGHYDMMDDPPLHKIPGTGHVFFATKGESSL